MDEPEIEPPVHDPDKPWYEAIQPSVFYPALGIILAFVALTILDPDGMGERIGDLRAGVIEGFGWYYAVVVSIFVVFSLWVGLSHFGDIKLGRDDERAEFSIGTWLAMLFAAGMGIGLVFWGVAEPLHHLAGIPNRTSGVGGVDEQGLEDSLVVSFLHWGLHPWAIYVIVGLAIAYAVHVKRRPYSIRWSLQPIFGDRVKGWVGHTIDVIAIVGTVFGVATSLGLGVMQIAGGLEFLEIINSPSDLTLVLLIGGITGLAVLSVISGVKRGIKWLSNINMGLAIALLIFVFIAGPTLFFVREYIQGIGAYLQSIVRLSFNTSATSGEAGLEWQGWWTAFYWGWWISWAPFVGVFIARISRGRTVREFVLGVLLVPTLFSFAWFTILGGGAMHQEVYGDGGIIAEDGSVSVDLSLFQFLEDYPGTSLVAGATIILIVLFFVTSSDSGSLVVDMLASGGMTEPPTWSRILWSVVEGLVATALLLAGSAGLNALRDVAITIALPFSVIMILMCFALVREFSKQRDTMLLAQRRLVQRELTQEITQDVTGELTQTLIDEGVLEDSRKRRFRRRR